MQIACRFPMQPFSSSVQQALESATSRYFPGNTADHQGIRISRIIVSKGERTCYLRGSQFSLV